MPKVIVSVSTMLNTMSANTGDNDVIGVCSRIVATAHQLDDTEMEVFIEELYGVVEAFGGQKSVEELIQNNELQDVNEVLGELKGSESLGVPEGVDDDISDMESIVESMSSGE